MKCIADLHIKDPGSALTHFIAFVGSAAAAAPLLMKAAAEPDAQPSSDRCPGRLHCQHDSSVCGQHRLPHSGYLRKGKPASAQA